MPSIYSFKRPGQILRVMPFVAALSPNIGILPTDPKYGWGGWYPGQHIHGAKCSREDALRDAFAACPALMEGQAEGVGPPACKSIAKFVNDTFNAWVSRGKPRLNPQELNDAMEALSSHYLVMQNEYDAHQVKAKNKAAENEAEAQLMNAAQREATGQSLNQGQSNVAKFSTTSKAAERIRQIRLGNKERPTGFSVEEANKKRKVSDMFERCAEAFQKEFPGRNSESNNYSGQLLGSREGTFRSSIEGQHQQEGSSTRAYSSYIDNLENSHERGRSGSSSDKDGQCQSTSSSSNRLEDSIFEYVTNEDESTRNFTDGHEFSRIRAVSLSSDEVSTINHSSLMLSSNDNSKDYGGDVHCQEVDALSDFTMQSQLEPQEHGKIPNLPKLTQLLKFIVSEMHEEGSGDVDEKDLLSFFMETDLFKLNTDFDSSIAKYERLSVSPAIIVALRRCHEFIHVMFT